MLPTVSVGNDRAKARSQIMCGPFQINCMGFCGGRSKSVRTGRRKPDARIAHLGALVGLLCSNANSALYQRATKCTVLCHHHAIISPMAVPGDPHRAPCVVLAEICTSQSGPACGILGAARIANVKTSPVRDQELLTPAQHVPSSSVTPATQSIALRDL